MLRRTPKLIAKANRDPVVYVGAADVAGIPISPMVGALAGGAVGFFVKRSFLSVASFGVAGALIGWLVEQVMNAAGPINVGALVYRKPPTFAPTVSTNDVSQCIADAKASGVHGDAPVVAAAWGCITRGMSVTTTPPDLFTKLFFDCATKKRDALRAAHPGQDLYPSDYDLAVCAMQAAKTMAASRTPIFSASMMSRTA